MHAHPSTPWLRERFRRRRGRGGFPRKVRMHIFNTQLHKYICTHAHRDRQTDTTHPHTHTSQGRGLIITPSHVSNSEPRNGGGGARCRHGRQRSRPRQSRRGQQSGSLRHQDCSPHSCYLAMKKEGPDPSPRRHVLPEPASGAQPRAPRRKHPPSPPPRRPPFFTSHHRWLFCSQSTWQWWRSIVLAMPAPFLISRPRSAACLIRVGRAPTPAGKATPPPPPRHQPPPVISETGESVCV